MENDIKILQSIENGVLIDLAVLFPNIYLEEFKSFGGGDVGSYLVVGGSWFCALGVTTGSVHLGLTVTFLSPRMRTGKA